MRRAVKAGIGLGLGILVGAGLACRRSEARAPGKAVLPAIPSIVRFQPPADGLVTDAQLDRYARVRRAARGRTEEEAARAVGVDPQEAAWVRARVVEAIVYLETSQVRASADGTYARTIASLREAAKSAKDRETLKKLEEQIALLEKERAGLRAPDSPAPSVAANARRIAPRRQELDAGSPR